MLNFGLFLALVGLLVAFVMLLRARSAASHSRCRENVMVFDRVFDTAAEIHVHVIQNGAFLIDRKAIHWPVEIFVDNILRNLRDKSRFVEVWSQKTHYQIPLHFDCDEELLTEEKKLRTPNSSHVLCLNVAEEATAPTLIVDGETIWEVPAVVGRLTVFNGDLVHAVLGDSGLLRSTLLFNTWDEPPLNIPKLPSHTEPMTYLENPNQPALTLGLWANGKLQQIQDLGLRFVRTEPVILNETESTQNLQIPVMANLTDWNPTTLTLRVFADARLEDAGREPTRARLHPASDAIRREPSSATELVLSPLTTLRFRLGRLLMTSPVNFKTSEFDDAMLPLLAFLKTPRTHQECMELGDRLGLASPELRSTINRLKERQILEEVTPPSKEREPSVTKAPGGTWWDRNDAGHFDIRMHQIIQVLYGNSHTLGANFPLNADKEPLPWFSYPAIEYLETLDLSEARVFEFGSGSSTLYLESRCKHIISIEQNEKWLSKLKQMSTGSAEFKLRETEASFANAILDGEQKYDVIIVDAIPEFRSACIPNTLARIADEGIIILDDSAMYPKAYKALLEIDAYPIDFIGLSPMEDVVQTTTFFFNRKGGPPIIRKKLPHPKGSPGFQWDA